MGHCCSKKRGSDAPDDYIISIDLEKSGLSSNDNDIRLNCRALKLLLQGMVTKYKENGQLLSYLPYLPKFANQSFAKFAPFLSNFQWNTFAERRDSKLKLSKGTSDESMQKQTAESFSIKDASTHYEGLSSFKTHIHIERRSSTKLMNFDKLFEVFKLEIMQRNNFFFELAQFIGDLYYNKYESDLAEFQVLLPKIKETGLNGNIGFTRNQKEKNRVQTVFKNAQTDIQQFESFLFNCIKVFLLQVSYKYKGDDSLVPKDSILDSLALKLLFGKNKCYQTFFNLIRLSTIEEEIVLRTSFFHLKGSRPVRFGLEQALSLENTENPYESVIESLDYLDTYHYPEDKFQLIYQLRKQIIKEINRYYSGENDVGSKKIAITGDNLLPLYAYCLAQNGNCKLRAHQIFIETFLEYETLFFNEEGYCYSTFSGAIDSLMSRKDVRESLKDIQSRISYQNH